MYPRNFIAPDGRVFGYDSNGKMYYVNTSGTGSITQVGPVQRADRQRCQRGDVPARAASCSSAATPTARVVIDITGGAPVVTTTQSMSSQRRLVNATILADGKVLATGGSAVWNELTDVNNSAEIWNPSTGTWTRRRQRRPRAPVPLDRPAAAGRQRAGRRRRRARARRTTSTSRSTTRRTCSTPAGALRAAARHRSRADGHRHRQDLRAWIWRQRRSISRVALVKTGSVTHSFNMEQRFIELTFQRSGNQLTVQAPTRAADAPPGSTCCSCSTARACRRSRKIVRIGVAGEPEPGRDADLANPGQPDRRLVGTPCQPAAVGHRPERRRADLRRERPAARRCRSIAPPA